MPGLQLLSQKIHQLVRAYGDLSEENQKLRQELTTLREAHGVLVSEKQKLEENLATALLGTQALSEDEKQNLRRYLDGVVDEIDKILTSLHE